MSEAIENKTRCVTFIASNQKGSHRILIFQLNELSTDSVILNHKKIY